MDFFEAQDQARRRTKWLVLLFILAVLGTVLSVYAVAAVARLNMEPSPGGAFHPRVLWDAQLFGLVAAGVLLVVGVGSLYKIARLGSGGASVALSLGGVEVPAGTSDPSLRRLRNVVEEMSLASGVPVPAVFILSEESGINAFAAGLKTEHACVAVTQGALDKLTREELQGVVAHEFAHIRHGDMRLNVRLIGWLHGLLLIAIIGRGLMHVLRGAGRRRSSRSGKDGTAILVAIAAAGLALWIIGSLGVLFGRLIQAAVSRQREFLADAAAVELTRNPEGLAGALKKVGGYSAGGKVDHANAQETAHLFFANALSSPLMSMFATHPPIEERIRALDPAFEAVRAEQVSGGRALSVETPAATAGFAGSGGTAPPPLPVAPVARAAAFIGRLSDATVEELRSPEGARVIACAALLARGGDQGAPALAQIEAVLGTDFLQACQARIAMVRTLGSGSALQLLELALPALRQLNQGETSQLADLGFAIAAADGEINLEELCLACVLEQALALPTSGSVSSPSIQRNAELAPSIAPWLRMLSAVGPSDEARLASWRAGWSMLRIAPSSVLGDELPTVAELRVALSTLRAAAPLVKRDMLAAFRAAASADGAHSSEEGLLLRSLALGIGIPLAAHAG